MSPEEKSPRSPLNGWDLLRMFGRTFFLEAVWNYEKYLNYGVAYVLLPAIRKLYPPEERPQALTRHLEYFNTQPYMSCFVLGAVLRMEEEKQRLPAPKQKQKEEEISALKVGMMGPLAAMGDNLFWATLRPYCGLMAVILVLARAFGPHGIWIVPLVFLAVYNTAHLGMRALGFLQGYRRGDQVILVLRRYSFQQGIRGVRLASIFLLALFVVFANPFRPEGVPGLFLLKLAFFAAIVGFFTFALKKKISPSQMFYAVVLFALMLAFWPDISARPETLGGAPPALPGGGAGIK